MLKQRASVGLFSACFFVLLSCVLLLAACGTTQYRLELTASEGGTVTGTGTYDEGTVVTIKATPNDNYHFVGWYLNADHSGEPLSTNTSYSVTVDAEKAYYALFAENEKVTVTLTTIGNGTVVGAGDYYTGSVITITATPKADSHFIGWYTNPDGTGNPLSTNTSLEITIQDDITYYAVFRTNSVMVNAPVTTGGSVTGAGEYATGSEVTLTASASDLYDFIGWYSDANFTEPSLVSSDLTYTFTANDSITIYPRFETSALNFLNRIIDGAYYKYSSWTANDELSAYNMTGSVDFALASGNINLDVTLNAVMALDLDGTDSKFALELLNNSDSSTILGMYYADGVNNAKLYFNLNGTKYTYNFASLSQYLGELSVSNPSDTPWTLESIISGLLGDDSLSGIISAFLGYSSNGNWFDDFVVAENEIAFNMKVDVILDDVLPLLEMLGLLDENTMALLNGIFGNMPSLDINIAADFSEQNGHKVLEGASLNVVTDGDFPINADGIEITLPEFNVTLGVNNLDAGFANELATVNIDSSTFPETAINLLNLSVGADLNFYSGEASETLAHAYRLELNTDINPFAILPAITTDESGTVGFDVNTIEWENLGFLSLRIYPTGEIATDTNDYLNIYYDSNESTQIYIFGQLLKDINLKTSIFGSETNSIVNLNNSYDIRDFITMVQNIIANISELTSTQTTANTPLMAPALLSAAENISTQNNTINIIFNSLIALISGGDFNKIFVDTVLALTPSYTVVGEGLEYDAVKGITLNITEKFKDELALNINFSSGGLISVSLDLYDVIFGNDTTQLALKFDSLEYGKNIRNAEDDVVNCLTQKTFIEEFATATMAKFNANDTKLIASIDNIDLTTMDMEDIGQSSSQRYNANVTLIDGTKTTIEVIINNSKIVNSRIDGNKLIADVQLTLLPSRSCDSVYNTYLGLLGLRSGYFELQTSITLIGFIETNNLNNMHENDLLPFFSQEQITELRDEATTTRLCRTFLSVDLISAIPSDAEIMCTVTSEDGQTIVTTTGIVYNADRTVAATTIKWNSADDFDKSYNVEFYYMDGDNKIIIETSSFEVISASYLLPEVVNPTE